MEKDTDSIKNVDLVNFYVIKEFEFRNKYDYQKAIERIKNLKTNEEELEFNNQIEEEDDERLFTIINEKKNNN